MAARPLTVVLSVGAVGFLFGGADRIGLNRLCVSGPSPAVPSGRPCPPPPRLRQAASALRARRRAWPRPAPTVGACVHTHRRLARPCHRHVNACWVATTAAPADRALRWPARPDASPIHMHHQVDPSSSPPPLRSHLAQRRLLAAGPTPDPVHIRARHSRAIRPGDRAGQLASDASAGPWFCSAAPPRPSAACRQVRVPRAAVALVLQPAAPGRGVPAQLPPDGDGDAAGTPGDPEDHCTPGRARPGISSRSANDKPRPDSATSPPAGSHRCAERPRTSYRGHTSLNAGVSPAFPGDRHPEPLQAFSSGHRRAPRRTHRRPPRRSCCPSSWPSHTYTSRSRCCDDSLNPRLDPAIRMMHQAADILVTARPDRHFKRIERKIRTQVIRNLPPDNPAREQIHDERRINPPGKCHHIRDVRHPAPVRRRRAEAALQQVRRPPPDRPAPSSAAASAWTARRRSPGRASSGSRGALPQPRPPQNRACQSSRHTAQASP